MPHHLNERGPSRPEPIRKADIDALLKGIPKVDTAKPKPRKVNTESKEDETSEEDRLTQSTQSPPERGRDGGDAGPTQPAQPIVEESEYSVLTCSMGITPVWRRKVFALARSLKGRADVSDAPIRRVMVIVQEWYDGRGKKSERDPCWSDVWAEFVCGWDRVKFPVGNGPFAVVVGRARESIVSGTERDNAPVRLLVSLCRELQLVARAAGRDTFYLSCRTAGEIVGISHVMAWKYLNAIWRSGWIERVRVGSQVDSLASEWKFHDMGGES